ncbi:glycoside hydrolase family 3 N-terminal domain-containing protein [Actinomycetaceae bacterium MB13-C1-2]|nr:glycoside hydrolase family 3 N-terminal domain-containing protein [Actinomycetaceae bacterium MB13-C1-2]
MNRDIALLEQALEKLPEWPVEKVVGQLFSLAVGSHSNGTEAFWDAPQTVLDLLTKYQVGGICYYTVGDDGTDPRVTAELARQFQGRAELPLLFAADQEGGMISRVREPALRMPSAMAQSATDDWELIERLAELGGADLRQAGFNFAYAPVADVNTEPANPVIGVRSPSSSPEVVGCFDAAVVRGLGKAGVASCLKHFPGHGNTNVDSHIGLPKLTTTREQWERVEALPFRVGIRCGADSVMMGHLVVPGLDPSGVPATFSRPIVTGLLREYLGFEGVIVTDALDMAGAGHPSGSAGACVDALLAGNDQLLMPLVPEEGIEGVIAAVQDGLLDMAELRKSARRVLKLKLKLVRTWDELENQDCATGEQQPEWSDASVVNADLVSDTFARALTWRDSKRTWVLPANQVISIVPDIGPADYPRGSVDFAPALREDLVSRDIPAQIVTADELEQGGLDGPIILVSRNASLDRGAAERIRQLAPSADVVIATRSPYDASLVPEVVPMLLVYGDIAPAVPVLTKALLTGIAPGVLPVDLVDDRGRIRWPRRLG